MSYRRSIPLTLTIALAGAPSVHARDNACNALTDAAVKQILTPHHATMTETLNGKARQSQYIIIAPTRYLFVNGKWTSHPVDVKKEADETAAAMKARSQTCKRLGDEALAGQVATVYAVHSNDADSDSKVWIATASGMLLGQDVNFDGAGKPMHNGMSIRYDYANVQPPKM